MTNSTGDAEYYSKKRMNQEYDAWLGLPGDDEKLSKSEPAYRVNLVPAKIWIQALILFPTVILVALHWNTWPLLLVSTVLLVAIERGIQS